MLNYALALTLAFILSTILASAVGLAWAGILLKKDNLFDWLVPYIRKIKSRPLKNLIQCHKCVSGQFALWWAVGAWLWYGLPFNPVTVFLVFGWIAAVIVVTDALYPILKLDQKPGVPLECPPCPPVNMAAPHGADHTSAGSPVPPTHTTSTAPPDTHLSVEGELTITENQPAPKRYDLEITE